MLIFLPCSSRLSIFISWNVAKNLCCINRWDLFECNGDVVQKKLWIIHCVVKRQANKTSNELRHFFPYIYCTWCWKKIIFFIAETGNFLHKVLSTHKTTANQNFFDRMKNTTSFLTKLKNMNIFRRNIFRHSLSKLSLPSVDVATIVELFISFSVRFSYLTVLLNRGNNKIYLASLFVGTVVV